jgi:hypothetical protein
MEAVMSDDPKKETWPLAAPCEYCGECDIYFCTECGDEFDDPCQRHATTPYEVG